VAAFEVPRSKIQDPEKIQAPREIPKSKSQNPKPNGEEPRSKIQDPEKIQDPRSKTEGVRTSYGPAFVFFQDGADFQEKIGLEVCVVAPVVGPGRESPKSKV
jgi:hypothetical protein